jgi:hypothetical protein
MTHSLKRQIAEAQFRQAQKENPPKTLTSSKNQDDRCAEQAKTARLKELRLAQEAADNKKAQSDGS